MEGKLAPGLKVLEILGEHHFSEEALHCDFLALLFSLSRFLVSFYLELFVVILDILETVFHLLLLLVEELGFVH